MSELVVPLRQVTSSPAAARSQAVDYLRAHGIAAVEQITLLIVSELVTNAVLHGSEPIKLVLDHADDILRIEVCDGAPELDALASNRPGPDATRGRGLCIVESLAHRWGTTSNGRGKCVWAECRLQ